MISALFDTLIARRRILQLAAILVEARNQAIDQVAGTGMRDVAYDRRHVDDVVSLRYAELVVVKIKQLHGGAPLLDGYEDAVADLVVESLGQVPFTGRVLQQHHLAG